MELRTDRYKLKSIFPDKAKKYAQKLHKKATELEFVRKGIPIDPENIEIKEGERAAIRLITTPHLDRDGDILIPTGAMLDDFRQSPSVLYAHDYKGLPIGSDTWIKQVREGILAKTVYAKHQFAEDVYQCVKDKHLNSNSVGFIPIEAISKESDKKAFAEWQNVLEKDYGIEKDESDKANTIYAKWIMLEHSDVPVASNAQSLNLAVSKGETVIKSDRLKKDLEIEVVKEIERLNEKTLEVDRLIVPLNKEIEIEVIKDKNDKKEKESKGEEKTEAESKEEEEIITKPETTEDYHRIPVNTTCKITATITISAKEGIKALYCGAVKKVHTYLFDVGKWTMAEAKKWVAEHKDFTDGLSKETEMRFELVEEEILDDKDIEVKADETINDKEPEDEDKDDEEKQEKFNCECIKCGHKMTSEEHCDKLECPECGGKMRRAERPGPGKELDIEVGKLVAEVKITDMDEVKAFIKGLKDDIAELKEGRVLSTKNRTLVKDTIEALTNLKERLDALYAATEPTSRDEEERTAEIALEKQVVIEKDLKKDDIDARLAKAMENLLSGDNLKTLLNKSMKEAVDIAIKKKQGKVE